LFRFPLLNPVTLPFWKAATGNNKEWQPGQSSRLCSYHFEKNEYIPGHGKGMLRQTAVPTLECYPNVMVHCLKTN